MKEKAEELKRKINCFGENTEKYINFLVPIKKKSLEMIKMGKKLQKLYRTNYNLLTA